MGFLPTLGRRQSVRRLTLEPLEARNLLAAGDWFGSLIHDDQGDLFAVDLNEPVEIELLGRMDTLMFDVAFSPERGLYGVSAPVSGPSRLYSIDADLSGYKATIPTMAISPNPAPGEGLYLNGLEFREDGALFACGYDAIGANYVFQLDPTDGSVISQVSLGLFQSAGDIEFDVDGNMYVTTVSWDLLKIDPALSSVVSVGSLGTGDFLGLSYGPAPTLFGYRYYDQGLYEIDPATAVPTLITTLTHASLGGIDGAATVYRAPSDVGTVDFLELDNQQPVLGELWYRFRAERTGILTADLPEVAAGSGVSLVLYSQEANGDLTTLAQGTTRLDYEAAVAGAEYFVRVSGADTDVDVRLTNLVVADPGEITVYGTADDDVFDLKVDDVLNVVINGVDYQFDFVGDETAVSFLGGEGDDRAMVTGSPGDDTATLYPDHGFGSGPGYRFDISETTELAFHGGAGDGDSAELYGTALTDAAALFPATAQLTGVGFRLCAANVDFIEVMAVDGEDTAALAGTDEDELFSLFPDHAEFSGQLLGEFYRIRTWQFETTTARGQGGNDSAYLTGTDQADEATVSPRHAQLTGDGFVLTAIDVGDTTIDARAGADTLSVEGSENAEHLTWRPPTAISNGGNPHVGEPAFCRFTGGDFATDNWGFESVTAHGNGGGDTATLIGSDLSDTATLTPVSAELAVPGFTCIVHEFPYVEVRGGDGEDSADFTGSDQTDTVELWPSEGAFAGGGYLIETSAFETTVAEGGEGEDEALLHDAVGTDEAFTAWVGGGQMISAAVENYAVGFESVVGFASKDPQDIARFYDSPGKDEYISTPQYGQLIGDGFSMKAIGFDGVHAYATAGGFDVAKMYDSPQDDYFYGSGFEAVMHGDGFLNRAKYFEQIHAYASHGGHDEALLIDTAGDDSFYCSPIEGVMYGDGFLNRGKYFDTVVAEVRNGGHDVAYMMDSPGNDKLTTGPVYAELSGDGFKNIGMNFSETYAYASEGYDLALMYDSPGNDQFNTTAIYGALSGDGFHNQAEGFDSVNAYGTAGGFDVAKMFDSAEDDVFYANPIEGSLYHVGYFHHRAKYFDQVHAYATLGGHDTAYLEDSAADDVFYTDPQQGVLYRTGEFLNRAKHFEAVYAFGSEGNDTAYFNDSDQPDLFEAQANQAKLSNAALDMLFEVADFDYVGAWATGPGDTKDVVEPLSFTLELFGPWA